MSADKQSSYEEAVKLIWISTPRSAYNTPDARLPAPATVNRIKSLIACTSVASVACERTKINNGPVTVAEDRAAV